MTNTERTEALLACLASAVEALKGALEYCDRDYILQCVCDALKEAGCALLDVEVYGDDDDETDNA